MVENWKKVWKKHRSHRDHSGKCKYNEKEVCGKYETPEEMMEDFKKGGGCAFTWFFSGQVPKKVEK
jgi:hypothetical protein